MKINIQSPGFSPGQKLISFVNKKINSLSRLYGEIIGSEVCLRKNSSVYGENKICSIRLIIPGNDLLASRQYNKFEIAIVQTVEALKKQLIKKKTKIRRAKEYCLNRKVWYS
jgi:putative sigma-54 modulation protein